MPGYAFTHKEEMRERLEETKNFEAFLYLMSFIFLSSVTATQRISTEKQNVRKKRERGCSFMVLYLPLQYF